MYSGREINNRYLADSQNYDDDSILLERRFQKITYCVITFDTRASVSDINLKKSVRYDASNLK